MLLITLLLVSQLALGIQTRPTSIVVVLCDDLGFGDVEYNNPNPNYGARTPELNAMARAPGTLQMTNFHSTSSVCSPTRSSLLSGRQPDRECVSGANAEFDLPGQPYKDTFPFRPGMASIARNAKLAGYATGFFGKWHLGPMNTRNPGTMGFDTWIASTGNMPTYDPTCLQKEAKCHYWCKPGGPNECFYIPGGKSKKRCSSLQTKEQCYLGHYRNPYTFSPSWTPDMYEPIGNHTGQIRLAAIPWRSLMSDFITDRFEQFATAVPTQQAMFAYVWFHAPHHPFITSPQIASECMAGVACKSNFSAVTKQVDYLGVVVGLDRALGRIRRILSRLGRTNDTLLIFTSDNGPEDSSKDGAGSPSPYRAFKGTIFEGSHRVPGLIEWPATIKSNAKVDAVTSTLDLYRTFYDLFLAENPSLNFSSLHARPPDGVSLLPLLSSLAPQNWTRPTPFSMCQPIQQNRRFCNSFAFYSGKWKLVALRKVTYRLVDMVLYDVAADPLEQNNIASSHWDVVGAIFPHAIAWIKDLQTEYFTFCGLRRAG